MVELTKKHPNVTSVRFEDVITDPFAISERLYKFTSVKPEILSKLRFKSKKILNQDNIHKVKYGEEARKYWFSKGETYKFLDPTINNKQIDKVSRSEFDIFNSIASEQLKSFGYEII